MTSIVNAASSSSGSNGGNPFEQMRPSPRSEEDDIRKGVFGRALRLLHAASDEEKLRWRHTIEEATAAKQSSRAKKKGKEKNMESTEKGDTVLETETTTLGVKRSREGEEEEEEKNEGANGKSYVPASRNGCSEMAVPESDVCRPSDLEYIAAYLRTLLEKVVGLSLLELHVDDLRVLCVMLNIPLPTAKNKLIHYSTLASFYYTHCEKLGKRASSSHHLHTQLKRDEEMMRRIYKNEVPSNTDTTSGKTRSKKSLKNSVSKDNLLRVVDGNVSPPLDTPKSQQQHQQKCTATQPPSRPKTATRKARGTVIGTESVEDFPHVQEGQQAEELEVRHSSAVFTQQRPRPADGGNTYYSNNTMGEEWPTAQLEQKVASVVHLYDPVTTAVVVKKLAQMGYRSADAAERVEGILHSFHQRQFIFYDNGIAYLL